MSVVLSEFDFKIMRGQRQKIDELKETLRQRDEEILQLKTKLSAPKAKKQATWTGRGWNDADKRKLLRLWVDGVPIREIAKRLRRTMSAINGYVRKLREDGVDIPHRDDKWRGGS